MSQLIILTGKTASGKDTVISKLLSRLPEFKKILTTTSRAPRNGEQDGIDYHFISRDEFEQKIQNGEFLEYVEYGGNLYGTEKSLFRSHNGLIWKIDPSRAGKVRELISEPLVVIYLTVSDDVVLERLQRRGLSQEEIEKRMADDKSMWEENKASYDFVVENIPNELAKTVDKIVEIVENQRS
jgi:guanylate kinase